MASTDVEEPRLETDDGEQEFQVEGALECQVCYDFFHASIFQCADGHIICENCFHQLAIPRNCPSCKGSYPNLPIRNRALERIASQAVALELVANRNQATAAPQAGQGVKRPAGGGAPGNRNGVRPICHSGYVCDGRPCVAAGRRGAIEGTRYTCAACPNFDLCEPCAKDGVHAQHLLVRIVAPGQGVRVENSVQNWRNQVGAQGAAETTAPSSIPQLTTGDTVTTPVGAEASDDEMEEEEEENATAATIHDNPPAEPSFFPRYYSSGSPFATSAAPAVNSSPTTTTAQAQVPANPTPLGGSSNSSYSTVNREVRATVTADAADFRSRQAENSQGQVPNNPQPIPIIRSSANTSAHQELYSGFFRDPQVEIPRSVFVPHNPGVTPFDFRTRLLQSVNPVASTPSATVTVDMTNEDDESDDELADIYVGFE